LPLLPEGGVRVFAVEDPTILKGLSAGDRVRFDVEREGRHYVLTHLENSN
jgi:Cu/Ag efflux protein CusF